MNSPPDTAFAEVRDTDPETLDASELDAYLRCVAELRSWCDARQVRATRRQRALAAEGRATDPRGSLANHGRQSSKEAAAAAERERVCTSMPSFEDALSDGAVSSGHLDALANATRSLSEAEYSDFAGVTDDLLTDAERQGVDAFARNCRDLARSIKAQHDARSDVDELERQRVRSNVSRWIDRDTGMHKTLIECDPISDRQIWAAIQRQRQRLRQRLRQSGTNESWDRLTVDALVEVAAGSSASGVAAASGPRIVVHTDVATLTKGAHGQSVCETDSGEPVPVATMRRLACEADIIPVVLDGRGVVLDEGRAKRLATPEQRVALEAMQATCSHPDCSVSIDDCRIHHVEPWQHGGRTDLAGLAPLCETHHHLVHEGGWSLMLAPDRSARWVRPDGVTYWTGPTNDRSGRRLTA